MFLKFKKGKQKEIINKAITKAQSERNLCKLLQISKGTIHRYKFELTNINKRFLSRILNFLGEDITHYKKHILKELPNNWGRAKGGISCINKKKKEGKFNETIDRLKDASSKYMKEWHDEMKKNHPERYFTWQYERFKKIGGGYLYKLIDKTPVRNKLEKEIGDFLISEGFKFEYEPYMNIKNRAYFPDFRIEKKIIEVTEWKHPNKDKLLRLKRKLKDYKEDGFKIIWFIPLKFRKFYKELNGSVISTKSELKEFLEAPVA